MTIEVDVATAGYYNSPCNEFCLELVRYLNAIAPWPHIGESSNQVHMIVAVIILHIRKNHVACLLTKQNVGGSNQYHDYYLKS